MAKFDKQSLCHKKTTTFFGMTLLHAYAHYICIVCAKYQTASVKALVQADFLMYALSKHKHNPYLIVKMAICKFTKLSFCQKLICWHQTYSHKCSMRLYCVSKYQIVSAKAVVQVDFPARWISFFWDSWKYERNGSRAKLTWRLTLHVPGCVNTSMNLRRMKFIS